MSRSLGEARVGSYSLALVPVLPSPWPCSGQFFIAQYHSFLKSNFSSFLFSTKSQIVNVSPIPSVVPASETSWNKERWAESQGGQKKVASAVRYKQSAKKKRFQFLSFPGSKRDFSRSSSLSNNIIKAAYVQNMAL